MAEISPIYTTLKNGDEIIIRSAKVEDAYHVMQIGKHLMDDGEGQVICSEEFTFDEKHESQWIKKHLDKPSALILLVQYREKVIGILNFETQERKKISHTGEFGMGLHNQYRSLGIGTILLKYFVQWAIENPLVEKLNLRVLEDNPRAIQMYKTFGFKEDGRKSKEIKLDNDKYLDDISMELLL